MVISHRHAEALQYFANSHGGGVGSTPTHAHPGSIKKNAEISHNKPKLNRGFLFQQNTFLSSLPYSLETKS